MLDILLRLSEVGFMYSRIYDCCEESFQELDPAHLRESTYNNCLEYFQENAAQVD